MGWQDDQYDSGGDSPPFDLTMGGGLDPNLLSFVMQSMLAPQAPQTAGAPAAPDVPVAPGAPSFEMPSTPPTLGLPDPFDLRNRTYPAAAPAAAAKPASKGPPAWLEALIPSLMAVGGAAMGGAGGAIGAYEGWDAGMKERWVKQQRQQEIDQRNAILAANERRYAALEAVQRDNADRQRAATGAAMRDNVLEAAAQFQRPEMQALVLNNHAAELAKFGIDVRRYAPEVSQRAVRKYKAFAEAQLKNVMGMLHEAHPGADLGPYFTEGTPESQQFSVKVEGGPPVSPRALAMAAGIDPDSFAKLPTVSALSKERELAPDLHIQMLGDPDMRAWLAKNPTKKPDDMEREDPVLFAKIHLAAQERVSNAKSTSEWDKEETAKSAQEIADAIENGDQPPDMKQLYHYSGPVRAALARDGFNYTRAHLDWLATTKYVQTMQAPQQIRLRQAVNFAHDSIPVVKTLIEQWDSMGLPLLSKANLDAAASGTYGTQQQSLAVRLRGQIADMTSELGTVYKGGNSSTDESLRLAAQNLQGDWSKQAALDALGQIEVNIKMRENSIRHSGIISSPANRYAEGLTLVGYGTPAAEQPPPYTPPGATTPPPPATPQVGPTKESAPTSLLPPVTPGATPARPVVPPLTAGPAAPPAAAAAPSPIKAPPATPQVMALVTELKQVMAQYEAASAAGRGAEADQLAARMQSLNNQLQALGQGR